MIGTKMCEALNEQVNRELYSEYLYLSMAAWFEGQGLKGYAQWMYAQTQEEHFHAMKIFRFIASVGGKVELKPLQGPPVDFESPLAIFEAALDHERFITASINERVALAIEEKDFAANSMLQWFVDEQVEEETSVGEMRDHLKLAAGAPQAVLMLDQQAGTRVYAPPAGFDAMAGGLAGA